MTDEGVVAGLAWKWVIVFYLVVCVVSTSYAETGRARGTDSYVVDEGDAENLYREIWQDADAGSPADSKENEPPPKPEVSEKQEEARERELTAEQDALTQRQAKKIEHPEEVASEPDTFEPYISLRGRYRYQQGDSVWSDGDTRLGLQGQWQYQPDHWFGGRAEVGLNFLDNTDVLFNPSSRTSEVLDSDPIFIRLFYVAVDTPNVFAILGKNWSTYYQVSSFTDRFQGTGGSASGTYNAGTDGGSTGTGRADGVLQSRSYFSITPKYIPAKPFRLNVQFQYGQPVPSISGATYGLNVGLSAIYEMENEFEMGLAYNHANVQRLNDPVFRGTGIDGDAQALVFGTRWFNDKWYLATTVARLVNHENTDEDIYFDGTGWEVYSQYKVKGPWYVVGGWNALEPDSGQILTGRYRVKYGVVGARYSFDQFRRMLYFNVRLDESRNTRGETRGDLYSFGIRWDFS